MCIRDNLDLWIEFLGYQTSSSSAASTTRWRNDHIYVAQVFEDLQTNSSDARDQFWLVSRMDVAKTFDLRCTFSLQSSLIKVASMQSYFGAKVSHCL